MSILDLAKTREERDQKEKIDSNQKLAQEIFEQLKGKNLQVQDAMLVIKFLTDIIQGKSGKKIQETYLNHL